MSIGLAAVLSQAGKLYRPSAAGIVLSVCAWTGVLVGGIMLLCRRMDRDVQRIRVETQTTDADHIHWRILLSLAITLVLCAWRARQRRHSAEVLGA